MIDHVEGHHRPEHNGQTQGPNPAISINPIEYGFDDGTDVIPVDADGDDASDKTTSDKTTSEIAQKGFPPWCGIGGPTGGILGGPTSTSLPSGGGPTGSPLGGFRCSPQPPEVKRQANSKNGNEAAKPEHDEEDGCEDGD